VENTGSSRVKVDGMMDCIEKLEIKSCSIWGAERNFNYPISDLLGSSLSDIDGEEIWHRLVRTAFIAPNFYLEIENPNFITQLDCVNIGSDRDDRSLYYFLKSGYYVLSTNKGFLHIAHSTFNFFDLFLTYGEWVEKIIFNYGDGAYRNASYTESDIDNLEIALAKLENTVELCFSFWGAEVLRLRKSIEV